MTSDVHDRIQGRDSDPPPRADTAVKSYRYLRLALIGLLVGLAVAVVYQTARQGFDLLSSVSAYYYTPAQAIFVGALIGVSACMVALRGTTPREDVFLNLGGIFAAVVAIVPTSRGEDFRTAVRACEQAGGPLLTERASSDPDCPTVRALADATRANVENNMVALLVIILLGLLATVLFARRETSWSRVDRVGISAATALFVAAAVAFFGFRDWYVDNAHYLAAIGLFLCIVAVAVENAWRHQGDQADGGVQGPTRIGVLVSPRGGDRYAMIARALLVGTSIGVALWLSDVITLFWLEILVALLFILFWLMQTIEQWGDAR